MAAPDPKMLLVSAGQPYYSDDLVTLYHGDCRDILPTLVGDALITDPPYGVGLTARHRRVAGQSGSVDIAPASVLYDDDPDEVRALLAEVIPMALERVTRALIFPGTTMMFDYPTPAGIGCVYSPAGGGYTSWGFNCFSPVFYYGPDPFLANGEGHRPNSMIHRSSKPEYFDHPCPKPLSWMNWAVNRASRDGETVIDPFAGTGTTLIAARHSGRHSIGIELEEHYCEIAAKRLAQGVLFGDVA